MGPERPPTRHIRTLLIVAALALVYQAVTLTIKLMSGLWTEAALAGLGVLLGATFFGVTLRSRRQPVVLTQLVVALIGLWFAYYVAAGAASPAALDIDVYSTLLILVGLAFTLLSFGAATWLSAAGFVVLGVLALTRASYDAELLSDALFISLLFAYASSYGHRILRVRERAELLQVISERDVLTDLLNRRTVQDRIECLMSAGPGERGGAAIILLDLDDFKALNDTLGHQAGDLTLVEVARFLRGRARQDDLVCRWGGEEFLILMDRTSGGEVRHRVAELVAGIRRWPIPTRAVTLSAGAAMLSEGETAREVIHLADRRMYEAKRQGKDRFVVGDVPELA